MNLPYRALAILIALCAFGAIQGAFFGGRVYNHFNVSKSPDKWNLSQPSWHFNSSGKWNQSGKWNSSGGWKSSDGHHWNYSYSGSWNSSQPSGHPWHFNSSDIWNGQRPHHSNPQRFWPGGINFGTNDINNRQVRPSNGKFNKSRKQPIYIRNPPPPLYDIEYRPQYPIYDRETNSTYWG